MRVESTEKQKMVAGELYRASAPELVADHLRAQRLLHTYNATGPDEVERRHKLLRGQRLDRWRGGAAAGHHRR
jgi:maltose O-acetyltransferase